MSADASNELRLVWVYPDLLSTYGDQGNVIMLARRAELRGIATTVVSVRSDQPVPTGGDVYLLGGGEDRPQVLAARRLRADGGLSRAAEAGAVLFGVCAGYQLMGEEFAGDEGQRVAGLGLLDVRSERGERRAVGEIATRLVPDIAGEIVEYQAPAAATRSLTGFENHQGLTHRGPGVRPLAHTLTGIGNGDGTDGAYHDHFIGTYLHGPVLARNPALADHLLTLAVGHSLPPVASWADRLHQERLNAVLGRADHHLARHKPSVMSPQR
ncbi:MAG: CobB/CobQ domain protein glutamine amidotransferase [Actinoallomurus sp.]|jgi:CobQ-like glutamine amidotransferase family enzyme|nr:CobB/CobQ domain protein glutamine amidotransferase [Actinoallomurus sp.]